MESIPFFRDAAVGGFSKQMQPGWNRLQFLQLIACCNSQHGSQRRWVARWLLQGHNCNTSMDFFRCFTIFCARIFTLRNVSTRCPADGQECLQNNIVVADKDNVELWAGSFRWLPWGIDWNTIEQGRPRSCKIRWSAKGSQHVVPLLARATNTRLSNRFAMH